MEEGVALLARDAHLSKYGIVKSLKLQALGRLAISPIWAKSNKWEGGWVDVQRTLFDLWIIPTFIIILLQKK